MFNSKSTETHKVPTLCKTGKGQEEGELGRKERAFVLKKLAVRCLCGNMSMIWGPNLVNYVELKKTTERKYFKEERRVAMRKS